jgi:hypothetical protein
MSAHHRVKSVLTISEMRICAFRGPKRARVAVARKLAAVLGRIWKDGTHFAAA